jgi:formate-dependent nitrite reductase membrane component NrfD
MTVVGRLRQRRATLQSKEGETVANRRRRRGGEQPIVPEAEFTSYYGRPVVKPAPWTSDIPAYVFLGGLAAGSAVLGAGADLTGRPGLRRIGRLGAAGAITLGFAALLHDLGKPSRFGNMLRVAKPTSPMSVGVWLLTLFGPSAGLAGAAELRHLLPSRLSWLARLLGASARPAGIASAVTAPGIATYTAVLLADTATPAWHEARRGLPFVFVGSAGSASGGLGMLVARLEEAGPARRMALGGAVLELAAQQRMESAMGLAAEPLRQGRAGVFMRTGEALTLAGAAGTLLASRHRLVAMAAGAGLLAGSAMARFAIFEAGQASARDPKYTVVPQRERLDQKRSSSQPSRPA